MKCHEVSCSAAAGVVLAGLYGRGFRASISSHSSRRFCRDGRARRRGVRRGCGHPCLLRGKGRDGCPCFARVSRVRACGGASARIAAARFARLIARARRREGDPCGNVMKCHAMSWRRVAASSFFAPFAAAPAFAPCAVFGRVRRRSVTGPCRASGGGLRLAAGFAAGAGRKSVVVIRASFGAKGGTGGPCFARVSRARACGGAGGRIAAARFARVIARARRRTHLARPFPPGSFSRPQPVAFCRNAERRPRKPPLSTFILHQTAKCQAPPGTKNENAGDFP